MTRSLPISRPSRRPAELQAPETGTGTSGGPSGRSFTPPRSRLPVGVLGATGSVGQRFVELLADHPWFELVAVTASERSAGKPYREAVRWSQATPLPEAAAALTVETGRPERPCALLFSALGSSVAGPLEKALAEDGQLVVTNASSHRMDPEVPLVIPEVNPDHLELVRGRLEAGRGAILANPNCSTIGLVLALKPLQEAFGVRRVAVTTLQAVSGGGLTGVSSMAILDNVVPHIPSEEDKLESEARKILGRYEAGGAGGGGIVPAEILLSAHCNRVPVIDGHMECVSLGLGREEARSVSPEEAAAAFEAFTAEPQALGLPTAPPRPVEVAREPDRPQPRLDRERGGGMAATVGRIRPCPLLGLKFVVLSHNTLRGAAGGALLLAELAVARGLAPRR